MFEWYVAGILLLLAGAGAHLAGVLGERQLLAAGAVALAATTGLCALTAWAGIRQHSARAWHRPRLRWVTLLNLVQPLVRGWGRLRRMRVLGEIAPERELHFWSGPAGREGALRKTAALLRRAGCRVDPGDGWQRWDFRCQLGGWAQARVTTAEQYDGMLRWRWELRPARWTWATFAAILVIAAWGRLDPRAFVLLLPLLAMGVHAVREQAALSKVVPRCVAQAARSMGMVQMEASGASCDASEVAPRRGRASDVY
jgi:hypothetical protein